MLIDHVERQTDPEEEGEGVSRGGSSCPRRRTER